MLDINLYDYHQMATAQTIKVVLQRDSLQTPWGFRLQGGADFRTPFSVNKVTRTEMALPIERLDLYVDHCRQSSGWTTASWGCYS